MGYTKILAGTDGSETATQALRNAATLAKAVDAELVVACIYDPPDAASIARETERAPAEVAWRITGSAAAEEIIERAEKAIADIGVKATMVFEQGDAADTLIRVAERESCDLIMVGNKGMAGVKRFLLGSVPNKVSHHAPCDVLIAKTT